MIAVVAEPVPVISPFNVYALIAVLIGAWIAEFIVMK
jgi:hypothetical protein